MRNVIENSHLASAYAIGYNLPAFRWFGKWRKCGHLSPSASLVVPPGIIENTYHELCFHKALSSLFFSFAHHAAYRGTLLLRHTVSHMPGQELRRCVSACTLHLYAYTSIPSRQYQYVDKRVTSQPVTFNSFQYLSKSKPPICK